MSPIRRALSFAGILLGSLTLPQLSFGITGCTNGNLMGTYNAQISSANISNVLHTVNITSGTGTTTGTTGTTTGTINATFTNQGGFGNNPNSLSGKIPGLGRYIFDGNGSIVGMTAGGSGLTAIGKYTVNSDCTATMSLNTGETFNAVIGSDGTRILFIESDANGGGAVGEFDLSTNACVAGGGPRNFAFSFFGAMPVTPPTTAAPGTLTTFQTTSAIGTLTLDGTGGFSLSEWTYSSGSVKPVSATGTYTVGNACNLQLTITQPSSGTTGTTLPMSFQGLLVSGSSGLLVLQPDSTATDVITGQLIGQ